MRVETSVVYHRVGLGSLPLSENLQQRSMARHQCYIRLEVCSIADDRHHISDCFAVTSLMKLDPHACMYY